MRGLRCKVQLVVPFETTRVKRSRPRAAAMLKVPLHVPDSSRAGATRAQSALAQRFELCRLTRLCYVYQAFCQHLGSFRVLIFGDVWLPNTLQEYTHVHLKYLHSFRVPVSRVRLVLELRDVAEPALRQQAQEEAPSLSHLPTKLCQ